MSGRALRALLAMSGVVYSACAFGWSDDLASRRAAAAVQLKHANASLVQTSSTAWSLTKTGTHDPATGVVRWTVDAVQGPTTSGVLIVNGIVDVWNKGSGDATIGNIVVNLQAHVGNDWVSISADVADATNDDAATSAHIDASASSEDLDAFTENAASGQLLFMDATSNTVFSLVPQPVIASDETMRLAYAATFDNNVLGLAPGTPVRAEVIVSFGNATPHPQQSAQNIDINGNGAIDADEAWVRSVVTRHGFQVPPQAPGNGTVTLSDTIDDIATTGTVTFTNPVFNIGATSGTVRVTADGGTDGGTITNCAHLTGGGTSVTIDGVTFPNVGAIDLEACDTQVIGSSTCTPGTPGCGWQDGDLITYAQSAWGGDPTPTNPAGILLANYDLVYASTFGELEVGIAGAGGFSIVFTSGLAVNAYLPALGTPGALTADHVNPLSTSAGRFGGEVTALAINVDFSDAGVTTGAAGLAYGDLTLCGFATLPALNNLTVRGYLDLVNVVLGGGAGPYSIAQLDSVTADLNTAFGFGSATTFAQDHLVNGACP